MSTLGQDALHLSKELRVKTLNLIGPYEANPAIKVELRLGVGSLVAAGTNHFGHM